MRRYAGRIYAAVFGGIVSIATILTAAVSFAAAEAPVYPDLVSDPPTKAGVETYTSEGRTRLLLRFEGYVHNAGRGALEIRGSRPGGSLMGTVEQRVFSTPAGYADRPTTARVVYETADGHDHWHLQRAARYSLWNAAKSAEVAPAMKVGFCLEDSERVDGHGPVERAYSASAGFCEEYTPSAPSVVMGVSAGWRDIYSRRLAFQWVDVSDVQPGAYWLRSEVDPDDVIFEGTESNAASFAAGSSIVPGYVAEPVSGERCRPDSRSRSRCARASMGRPALGSSESTGRPGAVTSTSPSVSGFRSRVSSTPPGSAVPVLTASTSRLATRRVRSHFIRHRRALPSVWEVRR